MIEISKIDDSVFIHPSSFVDEGVEIGSGTKIWHFSHIQSGAKIGKNCSLGQNVNVGNNVMIGDCCRIQNNVSLYEGVELGEFVFCGPSCVFTNVTTPRCRFPVHGKYKRTVVESGASLGANCTIVCGHKIGKNALIAAGAVVAKDVPAHALMVGVPARQKGWVCECGQVLTSLKATTHNGADDIDKHSVIGSVIDSETAVECPNCGRQYELIDGQLVEKDSTPPPVK